MTGPTLRVVHISQGLEMGGQERLLVEMARLRDRTRFDWTVIALGGRGVLAEQLEALGVRLLALDTAAGFRVGLWRRLARLFRHERIDVVHSHDDRPLIYGMPAAWWAGVPRRIHTHHHGKLAQFTLRQRWLMRQAARFAHKVVCVSHDSARYLVEQGIPSAKVQTIWNGIDLTKFAYHGPCKDGPIVAVARLSPEKDLATLLKAMPSLERIRLEIAGDGPCRAELERLARELQIGDRVTFHGAVHDIPGLLARARLFVLPSLSEGISLTLLEAMACGLPIVTTRVGGNPEVVEEGVTGILAPPGDPAAFAGAMSALLADPDRGRQMGQAGRQRVENLFDIRKMTARYEALYISEPEA